MQREDTQGRHIGRYEIKAVLGRGGMATVYRAHDTALRRDVALKVLYPQFGGDDSLIERFQREAVMAASLDHPNIVPIYDVGEAEGVVYIAMKLLNGRPLADLLQAQPILAPATLVPIIEQIAAALDYAHRRGIVHRDIKAANIMLEGADPGPFQAMLTDFGIAKSLDTSGMTTTGVLIGTPDYMAPEQIGQKVVDGRADIYALGVVAFRCLTGRRPFEGSTEQVLIGHLQGPIPDASRIVPTLPPVVDPILRKALAKRPEQRYASAGEFAHTLAAAFGFETLTPPPGMRRDVDARAVVPGIAAERIVRAQATDAPTQRSATGVPTQRNDGSAEPPRPVRPAVTTPPRSTPLQRQQRSNIGPMLAIALLLLALGGVTFALYRTLAANGNGGSTDGNLPLPPLPSVQIPTSVAVPTTVAAPTDALPPTAPPAAPSAAPQPTTPPAAPSAAPTTVPTGIPATVALPTPQPTIAAPPTVAPPTVAPSTAIPATVVPPTTIPPSPVPPTAIPPTAAPVACVIEPMRGFGTVLQSNANMRARIGCPTQNEVASGVAEQAFQRGNMLWYNYQNGEIFYVLKGSSSAEVKGTWATFTKDQVDAAKNQEPPAISDPPTNALYVPRTGSGFYYIWVYNEGVRTTIGYALKQNEDSFDGAAFQSYEGGMMLFTPNGFGLGATIYVLYNDSTFERYRDVSATAPN